MTNGGSAKVAIGVAKCTWLLFCSGSVDKVSGREAPEFAMLCGAANATGVDRCRCRDDLRDIGGKVVWPMMPAIIGPNPPEFNNPETALKIGLLSSAWPSDGPVPGGATGPGCPSIAPNKLARSLEVAGGCVGCVGCVGGLGCLGALGGLGWLNVCSNGAPGAPGVPGVPGGPGGPGGPGDGGVRAPWNADLMLFAKSGVLVISRIDSNENFMKLLVNAYITALPPRARANTSRGCSGAIVA